MATADFNHDGRPHLVTANSDGSTISVLLGNGNGTIQAAHGKVRKRFRERSGNLFPFPQLVRSKEKTMSRTLIGRRIFSFTFLAAGLLWLTAPAAPARGDILYVANVANNTIEKFTPGGVGSVFAVSGLNAPLALAFDGAGNLYAANSNSNTIEKFTPGGVGSVFASSGLNVPEGLAFDRAGNLYVANGGNGTIEKFTPAGIRSVFASSGLNAPHGLAFDREGNLYVARLAVV